MSVVSITQERRWKAEIMRRDGEIWPDVPLHHGKRAMRAERLVVHVDIGDDGSLTVFGATAYGHNVLKNGSLGAPNSQVVHDDWLKPLIREVLAKIAGTSWPEPRLS